MRKKEFCFRAAAGLLMLVMTFTCIGCAGKEGDGTGGGKKEAYYNETGYPICDEPITLTMMCGASGNMDLENRIMVEEIEKRFGIRLEITGYPTKEEFVTQLNLAMAVGDLPDLIAPSGHIGKNEMLKIANEGYALKLNEYADLMPNMQAVMEAYPEYEKYLTSEDGNIYGISFLEENVFGRVNRVYMNKNWLENVNMEVPKTVDELYRVLCAFRDQDANGNGNSGDEIPFDYVADSSYYDSQMLLAAFGLTTTNADYILSADESGKVVFGNTSENYKAYLKYMKKLYNEGLINPECYISSTDMRKENIAKDLTGFFGASAPFAFAGADVSYDANFVWIGGLTSEYNEERTVPLKNTMGSGIVMFANAETEYPEAVARFLDYWFSEEGEVASQRGWEGVTMDYERVGILDGEIATLYCPDGFSSSEDYKINKALVVGPFSYVSRTYGTHYRLLKDASEAIINSDEVLKGYGWATLVGRGLREEGIVEKEVFPNLVYTEEESKERASLYTDLSTYIKTQRADFISNPNVDIDAGWDSYIRKLETIGLDRILEIEQNAYDRYNR